MEEKNRLNAKQCSDQELKKLKEVLEQNLKETGIKFSGMCFFIILFVKLSETKLSIYVTQKNF